MPTPEYRLGIDVGGPSTAAVVMDAGGPSTAAVVMDAGGPSTAAVIMDAGGTSTAAVIMDAGGTSTAAVAAGGRVERLRHLLTVRQDHARALGRSVARGSYPVRSPESCV